MHTLPPKKRLSASEQVIKLRKKYKLSGLDSDVEAKRAAQVLLNKNYFDFINGLEELFPKGNDKPKSFESFSFADFEMLYEFNIQFRTFALRTIADFEIKLKSVSSYFFTEATAQQAQSELAYLDKSNYLLRSNYTDTKLNTQFNNFIFFDESRLVSGQYSQYVNDSNSLTEKLYKNKFMRREMIENELLKPFSVPPLWVTIKVLDFGKLYRFVAYQKSNVLKKIRIEMGFSNYKDDEFINAIHMIQSLRNILAHFQMVNKFKLGCSVHSDLLRKLREQSTIYSSDFSRFSSSVSIFDILRLLKQSVDISSLQNIFLVIEKSPYLPNQPQKNILIKNLLLSMGNPDISDWKVLTDV